MFIYQYFQIPYDVMIFPSERVRDFSHENAVLNGTLFGFVQVDITTPGLFKIEAEGNAMIALCSKTYVLKQSEDK